MLKCARGLDVLLECLLLCHWYVSMSSGRVQDSITELLLSSTGAIDLMVTKFNTRLLKEKPKVEIC